MRLAATGFFRYHHRMARNTGYGLRLAAYGLWLTACSLQLTAVCGQPLADSRRPSAVEFMAVDQVKVGMKGIGKSVFQGTRIEEFQVEVLGILPRVRSGHDLILVRCSGAGLEKTGVITGMSGSPVYIDGKLVGALSMTQAYLKEPLGMVTPIQDMLEILDRKDEPEEWGAADCGAQNAECKVQSVAGGFLPIPCPIAVSGSWGVEEWRGGGVGERFRKLGLELVPGSGESGASDTSARALEPGAAVGVCLVRGDMNASAIGTLTYRSGNRILAFGHPMYLGGAVAIPMVGGVIHGIFSSIQLSGKAFSPTAPIGAITQDRVCGIAGTIGQQVPMIPVQVRVKSGGRRPTTDDRVYRYEVLNQRLLTPDLLAMAVGNSYVSREQSSFASTVKADFTFKLRSYPAIRSRRWFSGDAVWSTVAQHAGAVLELLMGNEYEKVAVESVGVEMEVSPGLHLLTVTRVKADRERAKPGDSLHLAVTLNEFHGSSRVEEFDLVIPRETPEGVLQVIVTNPDSALVAALAEAGEQGAPRRVAQMVKLIEELGQENQLVVQGFARKRGIVIEGETYPNLPPSMFALLSGTRETGRTGATDISRLFEQRRNLDQVVAGWQVVRINIER